MKFYPQPMIRFYLRYVTILIFVLLPLTFFVESFITATVIVEDVILVLILLLLTILGTVLLHKFFWEKYFSVLILTEDQICWKCPFRKTRIMLLSECKEIGAYRQYENKGIPSVQVYFSDHRYPQKNMDKNGSMKSSMHLIQFEYSEALSDYIMKTYPSKYTSCLNAFRQRRK